MKIYMIEKKKIRIVRSDVFSLERFDRKYSAYILLNELSSTITMNDHLTENSIIRKIMFDIKKTFHRDVSKNTSFFSSFILVHFGSTQKILSLSL